MQAIISIGERRFTGQMQQSQSEAIESAASVAFCQLVCVDLYIIYAHFSLVTIKLKNFCKVKFKQMTFFTGV